MIRSTRRARAGAPAPPGRRPRALAAVAAAVGSLALCTSALAAPPVAPRDLGTLGGTFSQAAAINDAGQVVGASETAAGQVHAFLWTQTDGMVDLGTLGGPTSGAVGISATGRVFGVSKVPGSTFDHAFVWTQAGGMVDLGTLGGAESSPRFATAGDEVFGFSTPAGTSRQRAFSWTAAGGMVDLGALPGDDASIVEEANDAGQVVGWSLPPSNAGRRAFMWTAQDGMRDLGSIGGTQTQANDVNAGGLAAGWGSTPGGAFHAVVWPSPGAPRDIGTLGGTLAFADDVSDAGQVVGRSYLAGNAVEHPFSWTDAGGMIDLGSFGGTETEAKAVNESGQVVGYGTTPGDVSERGFSWTAAGGLVELAPLGGTGGARASSVNEAGLVAGESDTAAGQFHAVVWDPAGAAPGGDQDGDGVEDVIGVPGVPGAFDDHATPRATTGSIDDAGGQTVAVTDVPAPAGVRVTVSGTGGTEAALTICGMPVRLPAGADVTATCGSLTLRVVSGPARVVLDGGRVVVTVPAGSTAKVTDLPGGGHRVDNTGDAGDVDLVVDGLATTLTPGGTTTATPDATPPAITALVTGDAGAEGWFRGDVAVSWQVADDGSAVTATTGCDPVSVTTDTAGTTLTCTAGSAGGTTTRSVTVRRDATAPTVAFAAHPAVYTVDQTVAIGCSASDALSGILQGCTPVDAPAYTFAPGDTTLTTSAADRAGNTATATTRITVTVTGAGVCSLTRRFVQGSPRYAGATRLQRIAPDLAVAAGCAALSGITPGSPAAVKATLLAAYRSSVTVLIGGGWLTAPQGAILRGLADRL